MRIYNIYILLLAIIVMLTTVILSVAGQVSLDLYFSIYLIEYLVLTLLFIHFNPRARRAVNFTGYLLFGGFVIIVAGKALDVIGVLP